MTVKVGDMLGSDRELGTETSEQGGTRFVDRTKEDPLDDTNDIGRRVSLYIFVVENQAGNEWARLLDQAVEHLGVVNNPAVVPS